MFRFKNLFCFLAIWLGIIAILSINSAAASAAEKPEIFVQLAKESIIYCSGLKFMQEAQA
jgi:hypothetical protein